LEPTVCTHFYYPTKTGYQIFHVQNRPKNESNEHKLIFVRVVNKIL